MINRAYRDAKRRRDFLPDQRNPASAYLLFSHTAREHKATAMLMIGAGAFS